MNKTIFERSVCAAVMLGAALVSELSVVEAAEILEIGASTWSLAENAQVQWATSVEYDPDKFTTVPRLWGCELEYQLDSVSAGITNECPSWVKSGVFVELGAVPESSLSVTVHPIKPGSITNERTEAIQAEVMEGAGQFVGP